MINNKFDYLVYLGRFQAPHLAHIETIRLGLQQSDRIIILIGSSHQPRTIKNPWTWRERATMIYDSLPEDVRANIIFEPIADDAYNNARWVSTIQRVVSQHTNTSDNIGLIGHTKDETSFYLKMFPQWEHIETPNIDDINATDIRNKLFSMDVDSFAEDPILHKLPEGIRDYLVAWAHKPEADTLRDEYEFISEYHMAWASAPYEPTFVTTDALVVQSGHILLVKRRASPGKGLWAIVGGFVDINELIEDAMLRELKEETKINVPVPVLRGNIRTSKVYDVPKRSLRGRTITHAYLITLPPGPLPKVKGSDDAEKAKWISLNVVKEMRDQLFEDHYDIINDLVGL